MSGLDQQDMKLREALRQADEPQTGIKALVTRARAAASMVSETLRDMLPARKQPNLTFHDTSGPAMGNDWLTKAQLDPNAASNAHAARIATATAARAGTDTAMTRADAIVRSGGKVVRLLGASGPRR